VPSVLRMRQVYWVGIALFRLLFFYRVNSVRVGRLPLRDSQMASMLNQLKSTRMHLNQSHKFISRTQYLLYRDSQMASLLNQLKSTQMHLIQSHKSKSKSTKINSSNHDAGIFSFIRNLLWQLSQYVVFGFVFFTEGETVLDQMAAVALEDKVSVIRTDLLSKCLHIVMCS
jgi:hypothetical protein